MAFTPGFYIPDAPPPNAGGDGDIDIDPAALDKLKAALRTAAEDLETGRFSDVQLDSGAFGGCPSGAELGAEHRTAHAIIVDTIQGVVTDMWGYRAGIEQFEAGMGTADDTAASDLLAREAAVEALQSSAASNHGQNSYLDSRANHLSPTSGSPEAPGRGDGAGSGDGDEAGAERGEGSD